MEDTTTHTLAESAFHFHSAECEIKRLGDLLMTATADHERWLPVYFANLGEAIDSGKTERAICAEVKEASGRSRTSVQRDIARAVVAEACGWSPEEAIRRTPDIGNTGRPSTAEVKSAVADVSRPEARAAVRALFSERVIVAPEPATETEDETETEDTGGDNATGGSRGPVLPAEKLQRALTEYANTEGMDARVFVNNVNAVMRDIVAAKWETATAKA
jgi:hypothetical protein